MVARSTTNQRPTRNHNRLARLKFFPDRLLGGASLLAQKHDKAASKDSRQATLFDHGNLRGPGYYH
jgi:hypothetical protein